MVLGVLTEKKSQYVPSTTSPSPLPPENPLTHQRVKWQSGVLQTAPAQGSTPGKAQHPDELQGGCCWPAGDGCPGAGCARASVRGTGQMAPVLPTCPMMDSVRLPL